METTKLTIHLPKEISYELDKMAKADGRRSSDLAAEIVSYGLQKRSNKSKLDQQKVGNTIKLIDKTFGSLNNISRKNLISLAEDEEFSGY